LCRAPTASGLASLALEKEEGDEDEEVDEEEDDKEDNVDVVGADIDEEAGDDDEEDEVGVATAEVCNWPCSDLARLTWLRLIASPARGDAYVRLLRSKI
jgi:hypothetical protein